MNKILFSFKGDMENNRQIGIAIRSDSDEQLQWETNVLMPSTATRVQVLIFHVTYSTTSTS